MQHTNGSEGLLRLDIAVRIFQRPQIFLHFRSNGIVAFFGTRFLAGIK